MARSIGLAAVLVFLLGAVADAQKLPFSRSFSGGACNASVGVETGQAASFLQAYCEATCYDGSKVSTPPSCGTCSAVDADCAHGLAGWVSCSGSYTSCPTCPPSCEATNNTACSSNGAQIECVTSDNWVGFCNCFRSKWTCTL
jgi:hypothetical protein